MSAHTPSRSSTFRNIRKVDCPTALGYQVTLTTGGRCYEPFIPGSTDVSLRAALRVRNELYVKHNTGPRLALLRPVTPPVKKEGTTSGYTGVYQYETIEKNGSKHPVFGCNVRNLSTGKSSNKGIRIHLYPSYRTALKEAVELTTENNIEYNRIVDQYNKLILPAIHTAAAAEAEAEVLTPLLGALVGFNKLCWSKAKRILYPDGIIDPIDVRKQHHRR